MSSLRIESRQGIGLAGPVVLLAILAALVWAAGDRMLQLEFAIYDFMQRQQPGSPSEQILLIDTSAGLGGDSLWQDTRMPDAIDRLTSQGAAAIVPTQPPPANSEIPDLGQLTNLLNLEKRASNGNDRNAEVEALTTQLAQIRQQLETGKNIHAALERAGNVSLPLMPADPRNLSGLVECGRLAVRGEESVLGSTPPAREYVALPDGLCESAATAGYLGFRPDPDGVVRESALLVRSGDRVVPTLALAALAAGTRQLPIAAGADGRIALGDQTIRTGPQFTVLNRYYTSEETAFPTISLEQLMADDADPATVSGRIVLIGPLAMENSLRVSGGRSMGEAAMVATSLSNLMNNDYLLRPAWLKVVEILLPIALAALFLLVVPGMTVNSAALGVLILASTLLTAEAYLLLAQGLWIRMGMTATFSILGVAALFALRAIHVKPASLPMPVPQPVIGHVTAGEELDLEFSVLRQQAPTENTKEKLYQIALDHGRRKEYAKAERVLRYLASIDPDYRGVREKLKKLSGSRKAETAETPEPKRPAAVGGSADGTGRSLGRYEVRSVLGRGAMATVYLGRDPKINRKVAIKTIALADEFSEEDLEQAKAQFLREAESAGRLNHPNIIAIYDVGEDDDVAYLAMEYFEGKSLSFFSQPGSLLPPGWVLELGARAAEALHYAHSQNVVHRDIKPANIMYNAATDELKLTDFGIARLTDTSRTKTGIILGTPSYMSPEQLSGIAVGGQSDLYSLGITLYQMMTGAPPFRADSIPKLMDKIVNERARPLSELRDDLPPCVDELFERILAKDPEDRFPTGRAMALALRDCCNNFADQ